MDKPIYALSGLKLFERPARFNFMSEFSNRQINQPSGEVTLPDTEARQGKTGLGVRYVLAISLGAVIIIFAVLYLAFGFGS